jgi:hypothetical protein
MLILFTGKEELKFDVPNDIYKQSISPSNHPIHISNENFAKFLLSDANPHKALFSAHVEKAPTLKEEPKFENIESPKMKMGAKKVTNDVPEGNE